MPPKRYFLSGRGKKWMMSIVSFTVLCSLFGLLTFQLTKKPVTVILDGKKKKVSVHAKTVRDLLKNLKVKVGKHDIVKPGLDAALRANTTVRWSPTVPIELSRNGKTEKDWTAAGTVSQFLKAQDIQVGSHDKLSPSLGSPIKNGMKISYSPGIKVDLKVAGKEKTVWTTTADSTTVGDFLKHQQVKVDSSDKVKPDLQTPLTAVSDISVTRIKKVTDVVENTLDYAVVTKNDSSLQKGKKKVLNPGQEGKVKKVYAVTMKNGKEVSRKLVDTKTVQKKENRVVAVGTKVYSQTSHSYSSSSGSSSGSGSAGGSAAKQFYVSSTAYTASCSGCSGFTTLGLNLKTHPNAKVIAVDPSLIPLGSRVWVQGYGYAIAGDTGGAIHGHKIDVFFPTKSGAYGWGSRTVLIKVLN